MLQLGIDELAAVWRHKMNQRQIQQLTRFWVLRVLILERLRQLRTMGEAHRGAHWSCRPRPYSHPIGFFVVKDSADRAGRETPGRVRWTGDSVCIHRLPGTHRDPVRPPLAGELAGRLRACINPVDAG